MAIAQKLSQALNALKTLIYQRTKVHKDEVEDIAQTAYLNNEISVDLTPTIQALTDPDLTPTKVFARSFINEQKIEDLDNDKVDKQLGYSLVADTEISRLANVDNYDDSAIVAEIDALQNIHTIMSEPTGFLNPVDIIVTYDSVARTVTLTGPVEAYYNGVHLPMFVDGWVSPPHAATPEGNYYLYYNGTDVVFNQTPWTFEALMIAFVQNNSHKMAIREVHGLMQHEVHQHLHENIGTYRRAGGDFSDYTLSSTTAKRPNLSVTTLMDEDLQTNIPALTTKQYTVRYLQGAAIRSLTPNQPDILPLSGNQPYFNENVGGVWQQSLMSNNNYACVFVVALPVTADAGSQTYRYMFVQPQQQSPTLSVIQALTPNNLVHGDSANIVSEFCFIAKIIIHYLGGNWSIVQVDKLVGSRVSFVSIVAGQYLTVVNTNSTLTGDGTPVNPLGVNITKADVGLNNVDNTSDLDKPVSTAQQAALDAIVQDKHYTHTQMVADSVWTINHNLEKRPSVMVFNSFDLEVIGEVTHISDNQLTITFIGAFSGVAYLN